MKIGFIGLGLMGNPMAKNILKAGFNLTVYNRTSSKTKELEKLGAKVAKTPQDLTQQSDIIITMITAGQDVEQVLFGNKGVIKGAQKGLIIVDMGTIGPTYAKKIAKKLQSFGIEYLDAPVTGSTPGAINGTLTIFIGGKKEIFEKVKPVFSAMGKTLHYMGPNGMGQAIKMINNFILASVFETLSECMLLADTMGLPRKKTAEVLQTVPASSPMMILKLPSYINETFPLLFSMANMSKDVTLALQEMKKGNAKLATLQKMEGLYKKAAKKYPNEDFTSIIKILK